MEEGLEEPLLFKVNYLLFGTFMSFCGSLELNGHYLKMTSVSPNILGIHFTYDINIGFSDINQLMYCPNGSLVLIELNKRANRLIKTAMNLGDNSPDGLRFDVDSEDVVERYILIDVLEETFSQFLRLLLKSIKVINSRIIVKQMTAENAKRYLSQNHRKCEASHKLYRMKLKRSYGSDH